MHPPLQIEILRLLPDSGTGRVFDMTRRCAVGICTGGEFEIRILNERYRIGSRGMFACMPFINVEVTRVSASAEMIFIYIGIKDVLGTINRWVNTENLMAIQNNPVATIREQDFLRLEAMIRYYARGCREMASELHKSLIGHLQTDIITLQSRLIIAEILKIYFKTTPMVLRGQNHRDMVFQRFMLTLYANFRAHREVSFYAASSGVSLKYFSTIIRQLSGSSPSEWIETVVTGEAKAMLNDSRRSIKDIASTLNFPDAPTFTKYFRRITGMTPKTYRQSLQP